MTEQSIPEYLSYATTNHASDIFIIAGRPLSFKIDGKLSTYGERMMPADTESFLRQIYHMANDRNFDSFLETGDDDFSFSIPGLSRFRVNTYRQQQDREKECTAKYRNSFWRYRATRSCIIPCAVFRRVR